MAALNGREASYPFRADRAFIGFAHRKPHVRYSFDGRRLVCWEVWHVRAMVLVFGAVLGPGLTALWTLGQLKSAPWYVMAMVLGLNAVAWLGWIDALRHCYQVVCDLASRELQLFRHPGMRAAYSLSLDRVESVEIETLYRVAGRHGNPMRALAANEFDRRGGAIACYSVVVVKDDGEFLHLLESTDRSLIEAIQAILSDALRSASKPEASTPISRLR